MIKKIINFVDMFDKLKNKSKFKFIESIDVAINLDIDTKRSDHVIKGTVYLPHGTGKKLKIVVFTERENYNIAYSSGAYYVGMDKLFKKIIDKKIVYDLVISDVNSTKYISKLGVILGPKGLMPNLKLGTITENLSETIKKFLNNKIIYKTDKFGIIHSLIGKINFSNDKLSENLMSLILSIKSNRPINCKVDSFIKKITISSTMGKGFIVNI